MLSLSNLLSACYTLSVCNMLSVCNRLSVSLSQSIGLPRTNRRQRINQKWPPKLTLNRTTPTNHTTPLLGGVAAQPRPPICFLIAVILHHVNPLTTDTILQLMLLPRRVNNPFTPHPLYTTTEMRMGVLSRRTPLTIAQHIRYGILASVHPVMLVIHCMENRCSRLYRNTVWDTV